MARPRQITDEQILEATRRLVREKGSKVSLDVVAKALGVTSPALLKRFKTREELFFAALRPNERELDVLFEVPIDARPFGVQLEAMIDRLSHYFVTTLPCVMALRECGVSDSMIHQRIKLPIHLRAVAAVERWLDDVSRRELIHGRAFAPAAAAIVGAVMVRMLSSYLSKRAWSRRSQIEYQHELAGLFVRALAAEGPAGPRGRTARGRRTTKRTGS